MFSKINKVKGYDNFDTLALDLSNAITMRSSNFKPYKVSPEHYVLDMDNNWWLFDRGTYFEIAHRYDRDKSMVDSLLQWMLKGQCYFINAGILH